jgi:tetratricopeptide (TPR) repeat protein
MDTPLPLRLTLRYLVSAALCLAASMALAQTTANESPLNRTYHRAHDLYQKGQYAAAYARFEDYAATADNGLLRDEAIHYRGVCAGELLLANTPLLAHDFRANARKGALTDASHYKLGAYYFRVKQYRNALYEFIEIEPLLGLDLHESEAYYFMTGYCHFVEGNLSESRAYFNEIIDYQNEYYHLANYFHAYVSFENREYDKALKGFRRIEKQAEFKDFVPIYITEVFAFNRQYDKVLSYGDSILANKDLQMKHVVELLMAQAHFKLGNYQKSRSFYQSYSKLRKLGTADCYQYGYACLAENDYAEAIGQFESFTKEADSLGQNVSYLLGDAYVQTGKKMEARNAFQFASSLSFNTQIQEDAHYQYAKLSHELSFAKAAIDAFHSFIETYPKSRHVEDVKVNYTRLLLSSNNYLEALERIAEIPSPSKKIDEAYQRLAFNVGLEYLDINNATKAREYLNLSLGKPVLPDYKALAHFWIGESLYLESRYAEAKTSYGNYLLVPESKEIALTSIAHYNLAYCHIKEAAYQEALYHLGLYLGGNNTIFKSQFDADAHLRMADCYYELRVYDKAIENYQQAVNRKYSETDYAMFQIGVIRGLQGNVADKIKWLDQMVSQYPKSAYTDDALFEKANEKFIMGNKTQALSEFEYLNLDFPNNVYHKKALQKIGLIYYQLDQPEKSIAIFKGIVEEFPSTNESKESLRILKDIYTDWGKADEYFTWLQGLGGKYNIRESERDSALFQSGLSYLKNGDCQNTVTTLGKYLEQFPQGIYSLDAWYYTADCLYELDNFTGTLQALDQIIDKAPNEYSGTAVEKAAALCYERDSFALAVPYLELRTQVTNNNTDLLLVYEALARCHLELDNCVEAEKYLKKIKAFDNAEREVIQQADYTLARCAMAKGNHAKAISVFQDIANDNPNRLGAECQYLVGYLHYTQEDFDSAKIAILQVKNNFPSQDYFLAKSFILLADIYVKKEDLFNAKVILNSIAQNYAGKDLVDIALGKLAEIEILEGEKKMEEDALKHEQETTLEYDEK